MIRFHWGGQVSADIQVQNQMLFDAMTPEQQQQVLTAQAKRNAVQALLQRRRHAAIGWSVGFIFLAISILNIKAPHAPDFLIPGLLLLAAAGCWWMYERALRNIVVDAEGAGIIPKASAGGGQ